MYFQIEHTEAIKYKKENRVFGGITVEWDRITR